MSIANVYVVILIYALILSILTIDKNVIYHVICWEVWLETIHIIKLWGTKLIK